MIVLDPGHDYKLENLDRMQGETSYNHLTFVKRIGEKYPGNTGWPYSGTTMQEVLRVLIDRTKYVNAQQPDYRNDDAISFMRAALRRFEERAAIKHGYLFAAYIENIEDLPVDPSNGHITSCWRNK